MVTRKTFTPGTILTLDYGELRKVLIVGDVLSDHDFDDLGDFEIVDIKEPSKPTEIREVFDPFLGETVLVDNDLKNRLRGRMAIGPTMANGEPEFGWRNLNVPSIQFRAAERIEQLEEALRQALHGPQKGSSHVISSAETTVASSSE